MRLNPTAKAARQADERVLRALREMAAELRAERAAARLWTLSQRGLS